MDYHNNRCLHTYVFFWKYVRYQRSSGWYQNLTRQPVKSTQTKTKTTQTGSKSAQTKTKSAQTKTKSPPKQNHTGKIKNRQKNTKTEPVKKAEYPGTVRIGTQAWAVANLNVSTFRNGDTIP